MDKLKITYKNVDDLIPYENNPRKNDNAVEAVAKSIKEFGFKVPIVIDSEGIIVAGHTRLKAAKQLGLEEVPCIIADDLTPEQVKAFRLADNKVSEFAEWDFELLEQEFEDLAGLNLFTGFEDFEIDSLTSSVDVDHFFEETEEHHKEPKLITCPHCGKTFEK
ncbi:ParB N-terminal domain-containing protein [Peptoniphilus catoniae]|uniref:ParB N-terminal domain-containing protein n=1 Tax=Peptoniphilus catoniae TaxID=1660341 RepID=UPI0010FF4DA9|nr:ParB N-terminal domain-containing protein [Peptoniphilus catoniae]